MPILHFLGTRGEIQETRSGHEKHSGLLIKYYKERILFDCGEPEFLKENPNYIFLTHAHPDHAAGLNGEKGEGTKIPVYCTEETRNLLEEAKVKVRYWREIKPQKTIKLGSFRITAFRVLHSIKAPAVCFKIEVGRKTFLYAPDVIKILDESAYDNVQVYIADGSSLDRDLIRKKNKKIFGHASLKSQITEIRKHKIPEMIITHWGKQLIEMRDEEIMKKLEDYSDGEVEIILAKDGMQIDYVNGIKFLSSKPHSVELIADIKTYDPMKLIRTERGKKVLADDHRICFPTGTPVMTDPDGFRPIEELSEKDRIIIGTERAQVLKKFERGYAGEIVRFRVAHLGWFEATPDHPILVTPLRDIGPRLVLGYTKRARDEKGRFKWIHEYPKIWRLTKELKANRYAVIIPLLEERKTAWPKEFFALAGWYLAEGFPANKTELRFSLALDEEDFAEEICGLAKKVYGCKAKWRKLEREIRVSIYSQRAVQEMVRLFGKGALQKRIPLGILQAERMKLQALLEKFEKGDGWNRGMYRSVATASGMLAYSLFLAYAKCGIVPSVHVRRQRKWSDRKLWTLSYYKNGKRKDYWIIENELYLPIRKVEWKEYSGQVYNIETSNGEYAVPFIVHNCHAWAKKLKEGKTLGGQFEGMPLEEQKRLIEEAHMKIVEAFEKLGWKHFELAENVLTLYPPEDKHWRFVLQAHVRGTSVHLDDRNEITEKRLKGVTMNLIKSLLPDALRLFSSKKEVLSSLSENEERANGLKEEKKIKESIKFIREKLSSKTFGKFLEDVIKNDWFDKLSLALHPELKEEMSKRIDNMPFEKLKSVVLKRAPEVEEFFSDPNNKALCEQKLPEPIEWLFNDSPFTIPYDFEGDITYRLIGEKAHVIEMKRYDEHGKAIDLMEGEVPPGTVGATAELKGRFIIIDKGEVEYGAQKIYYQEWFKHGKLLNGKFNLRLLPRSKEWAKAGREHMVWMMFRSKDGELPYVLSRGAKTGWMPPKGISALPRKIREQIPEEFRYWEKDNPKKVRDELVKAIKSKEITIEFARESAGKLLFEAYRSLSGCL